MLMKTSLPVFFWISCLSLSTSCPLRPMMMPGREVKMLIFSLLAARSTSTRETPAWAKRFLRSFFRRMSSCRRFAYSFSAYQRLRQVLLKPEAEPDGVDFLSHYFDSSLFRLRVRVRGLRPSPAAALARPAPRASLSATHTVRCVVRLRTW